MDKENKYYGIIEKLVKEHRKFPGCEPILDEIIDDVYAHAISVINSVNDENVIYSYLAKIISTSIITVPKKMNFNSAVKHKVISSAPEIKLPNEPAVIKEVSEIAGEEDDVSLSDNSFVHNVTEQEEPQEMHLQVEKANVEYVDKMINLASEDIYINNSNEEIKADNSLEIDLSADSPYEEIQEISENDLERIDEIELSNDIEIVESANGNAVYSDEEMPLEEFPAGEKSEFIDSSDGIQADEDYADIEETSGLVELSDEISTDTDYDNADETQMIEETESDYESDLDVSEEQEVFSEEDTYGDLETVAEAEEASMEFIEEDSQEEFSQDEAETEIDDEYESLDNQVSDFDENEDILGEESEDIFAENEEIQEIEELSDDYETDSFEEDSPEIEDLDTDEELAEEVQSYDSEISLEPQDDELSLEPHYDYSQEQSLDSDSAIELTASEDSTELLSSDGDEYEFEENNEQPIIETVEEQVSEPVQVVKSDFKPTDYSVFKYTPNEDKEEESYNAVKIVSELAKLNAMKPEYKILQVYDLRYKQKKSVPEIAQELGISLETVVNALNEIVELV